VEQFEHTVLGDRIYIWFHDGRAGIVNNPITLFCRLLLRCDPTNILINSVQIFNIYFINMVSMRNRAHNETRTALHREETEMWDWEKGFWVKCNAGKDAWQSPKSMLITTTL